MGAVEVSGDEEFAAALNRLSADLDDPTRLLNDAGEVVAAAAAAAAPKRSGRLRGSIQVIESRGRTSATISGAQGAVRVVAMAPYSPFVHYGSIHNPHPTPFMDVGAARAQTAVDAVAEAHVDYATGRAGLT